jgi:hypothetical protein
MVEGKMKRALTVGNIVNQSVKRIDFTGDFQLAFKNPQNKGVWFIWGGSGSGKSSFVIQLEKEFARSVRTFHNELEEDLDADEFIERIKINQMQDVKDTFLSASYNYNELCTYLDKNKSIKVITINSATYFFNSFEQYLDFKVKYKSRIIIVVAHAQGKQPYSELEKRIMFNANQKIFVEGYLASCKGRTIGSNGGLFIIWKEGYEKLRGQQS